ncbi:dynein axonemal intermediate chain 4-like [Anableps anableps]
MSDVKTDGLQVFDDQGKNVTPLPLSVAPPEDPQSKTKTLSLDDVLFNSGSNVFKSSTVSDVAPPRLLCSSFSSMSSMESDLLSRSSQAEASLPPHDIEPTPAAHEVKSQSLKEQIVEENLSQGFDVILTETDTFSLLDIPPTLISEDAEDAEGVKQRNINYAEFCNNRMGNDNYLERSTQTFVGESKSKNTQTISNNSVNMGSVVSLEADMETCGDILEAEPNKDEILLSESFKNSLLVTESVLLLNIFQPKLATFKGLPVLEDPDSMVSPGPEEQSAENKDSYLTPTMEPLWSFVSAVTRGRNITSMTWNKKNLDILAVGYGDWASDTPGLICCWTLKNLTWSERVYSCHSSVTCLDFSASNPSHLAVGMYDGSVAIYNIQVRDDTACIANSRDCSKKHVQPVWQIIWTKQQLQLSGEEREELLVSISGDGRITKWLVLSNGFNCVDLMVLKMARERKKKPGRSQEKTENVLLPVNPVLCASFHPGDSGIYVIGTWGGSIHKCSLSNSDHFLDTFTKHLSPVMHVEWSLLYPDVFLSGSSDGTIQLWTLDSLTPKMSFTSVQNPVEGVKWSPNCSAVFAAIYKQRVEIWDLSANILLPTIVQHAAPGVTLAAVLFAKGSDCVLVGDSEGKVTVYNLKNFRVGKGKKVENLNDIMESVSV